MAAFKINVHFKDFNKVHQKNPGDDLLSHGETPHYHWRWPVSLLSSRWVQVVPDRYGRQEKRFNKTVLVVGKEKY